MCVVPFRPSKSNSRTRCLREIVQPRLSVFFVFFVLDLCNFLTLSLQSVRFPGIFNVNDAISILKICNRIERGRTNLLEEILHGWSFLTSWRAAIFSRINDNLQAKSEWQFLSCGSHVGQIENFAENCDDTSTSSNYVGNAHRTRVCCMRCVKHAMFKKYADVHILPFLLFVSPGR